MLSFLLFGSVYFWVALPILTLLSFVMIENDKYGWGSIFTILTGAFVLWAMGYPWEWLVAHKEVILYYFAGYFALGIVYIYFRWTILSHDMAALYKEALNEWVSMKSRVEEEITHKKRELQGQYKPHVSRNKARIISWGVYWPLSGIWYLLGTWVERVLTFVYNKIANSLQAITNHAFKDI